MKYRYNAIEKEKNTLENELIQKRNQLELHMIEEDNLKSHIDRLESDIKNLRISENDLKNKLNKKEEEYIKKISYLEEEIKKERLRYKEEKNILQEQLNETSKLNTMNFTQNED